MVLLPWRNTAGWGSFTGAHDGRSREKITSGCTKCFWSFTTISLLLWTDDSVSKGTAYLQSWRWSVRGGRPGKFSLIHSYSTRSLTSSTLTWKTATASWAHFCPFFQPEKKKKKSEDLWSQEDLSFILGLWMKSSSCYKIFLWWNKRMIDPLRLSSNELFS